MKIITHTEAEMQDPESQGDVNPGMVEQRMDEAPVEREAASAGGVEREGMQDGEVEREELRGGSVTEREREALEGQSGREDVLPPDGGSSR